MQLASPTRRSLSLFLLLRAFLRQRLTYYMTWEERWHPLRQEWVVVAAHRQDRPWIGEEVAAKAALLPRYLPDCYLCPGNSRISDARNPAYEGVFVFDNDHPCVGPRAPNIASPAHSIFQARSAEGHAKVVCYTPRHDLTLAELSHEQLLALMRTWQTEYQTLGQLPHVNHVLCFENKGDVVGVSNPHPHGQIYATNFIFKATEIEVQATAAHTSATGRSLFGDIIQSEKQDGRRVLDENEHALSFVPYFARYSYELYVAPKASHASLADLSPAELDAFARILKLALVRLDNLWRMPLPYVMVLHQAPTDGQSYPNYHFHIEFHPPLRKPNLLKYLAGPEIGGGNFVSDTSPEQKAEELRSLATEHYKSLSGEKER